MSATASTLRNRIDQGDMLVVPWAADALTARFIEQAGFEAVYATGAGISNSLLGLPDLGLATMTEIVDQVRRMTGAISIPLIADADTGYGNPVNTYRTVREFERAGIAAIQIEDQESPKRCGHFSGKAVVATEEMVRKIHAARDARQNPDTVIIARTDAIATSGIDEAILRGRAYAESGADVVFVEAPRSVEELQRIPQEINAPLLVNMTEGGATPLVTADELQGMGYRIAIFPNAALRVSMFAIRSMLAELRKDGTTANALERMMSWQDRQEAVGLPAFQELEDRYVRQPLE